PVRRHRPADQVDMTAIAARSWTAVRSRSVNPALKTPLALIGISVAVLWVLIAIFAPLIARYAPNYQAAVAVPSGPSWSHLCGQAELGRDVFSRVIYGARVTLPIGILLVVLSALIGGAIGAASGYFRGPLDGVFMRSADLVFAFPPIILAMVVAAVLGRGLA